MDQKSRLKLITDIALNLDSEYNTVTISTFFNTYGISFPYVSEIHKRRLPVIGLLTYQNDDIIIKIARDLKISVPKSENSHPKIFISHSSKDKLIVEQVIEILEVIGVLSKNIFCTSFEGYGVSLGADFLHTIKGQLNNEVLVLFILSSDFYKSPISLSEMGATWVRTNEHIPILVPPMDFSDISGVIPTTQGMKINEKEKLNSLKEKIEMFFSLDPRDFSTWERKRDNILRAINAILADRNKD